MEPIKAPTAAPIKLPHTPCSIRMPAGKPTTNPTIIDIPMINILFFPLNTTNTSAFINIQEN